MKTLKFFSSSIFLGIIISAIVLFFIAESLSEMSVHSETDCCQNFISSLKSFFGSMVSYEQTAQNSGVLRLFNIPIKIDIEFLEKIMMKVRNIADIIRERLPEMAVNFALDFAAAVKDIAVSVFETLKSLFHHFITSAAK